MTQGMLEAISGAIGEADNEVGGLIQTRLTAALQPTTALVAVYTWAAGLVITTPDTSEVVVGDWISLDADGLLFEVVTVTTNVSVEIVNPGGLPLPTGATASSKATRSLPVESALDWDESGKVGVDGIVYRYASRTNTSLDEITHLRGGVTIAGVKKLHRTQLTVINLNQSKTALDLVRQAMLVDFAEGEDLNALGRNLGVNRLPFLASDDVFRDIVKALAYNPKGTVFGLELALDALVGAGNYEIFEDLIGFPCTVFIKLLGAAATDENPHGKAFLTGEEYQPATGDTTVDIDEDVVSRGAVGSVRWKDEGALTDARTAYPSADTIVEYTGDPGNPVWRIQGTGVVEGAGITLVGGATEFTLPAPTNQSSYTRELRIDASSKAILSAVVTVPTGAPNDIAPISGLLLSDDTKYLSVGVFALNASQFQVGLTGFAWLSGPAITLSRDTYYEVAVKKSGTGNVELYVDGNLVQSEPYSVFPAAGLLGNNASIGHFFPSVASNRMRVKQIGFLVQTLTDFWAGRGSAGSVNTGNPTRLTVGSPFFLDPADVSKAVLINGGTTPNAQNGYNNGAYFIDSVVDSQNVELRGPVEANATVQGAFPKRIVIPLAGRQFQFPDDLGKEIVISGSTLGNDGTYVIDKLLQESTLVDLESFATVLPEKTSICEVVAASFVTEAGLGWQVNPAFVTEVSLDWVMAEAGSYSDPTLTLRQSLPIAAGSAHRVLAVAYSNVLSAQILLNSLVANQVIQEVPDLLFSYYPFYIADPLGFVRTYLDAITAAGVIPDFLIE